MGKLNGVRVLGQVAVRQGEAHRARITLEPFIKHFVQVLVGEREPACNDDGTSAPQVGAQTIDHRQVGHSPAFFVFEV